VKAIGECNILLPHKLRVLASGKNLCSTGLGDRQMGEFELAIDVKDA